MQAQTHDWENSAVLGINKLPYHATLQLPTTALSSVGNSFARRKLYFLTITLPLA